MLTSSDPALVVPILKSIGANVYLVDVLEDGTFRYFAVNWPEEESVKLNLPRSFVGKRPERSHQLCSGQVDQRDRPHHIMEKKTIAEFVESEAILDRLREIGVDYYHRIVIGHPKPITSGM